MSTATTGTINLILNVLNKGFTNTNSNIKGISTGFDNLFKSAKKAQDSLNNIDNSLTVFRRNLGLLRNFTIGGLGFFELKRILTDTLNDFEEFQRQALILKQSLKNVGAEENFSKVQDLVKQFISGSPFSLADQFFAISRIIEESGRADIDFLEKHLKAVQNLAVFYNGDLRRATTNFIRVFTNALGQLGKDFPTLRNLRDAIGDVAFRGGAAADFLNQRLGGLVDAFVKSNQGARELAKNQLRLSLIQLGETVSNTVTPAFIGFLRALKQLTDVGVNDPSFKLFSSILETIGIAIGSVAESMGLLISQISGLSSAFLVLFGIFTLGRSGGILERFLNFPLDRASRQVSSLNKEIKLLSSTLKQQEALISAAQAPIAAARFRTNFTQDELAKFQVLNTIVTKTKAEVEETQLAITTAQTRLGLLTTTQAGLLTTTFGKVKRTFTDTFNILSRNNQARKALQDLQQQSLLLNNRFQLVNKSVETLTGRIIDLGNGRFKVGKTFTNTLGQTFNLGQFISTSNANKQLSTLKSFQTQLSNLGNEIKTVNSDITRLQSLIVPLSQLPLSQFFINAAIGIGKLITSFISLIARISVIPALLTIIVAGFRSFKRNIDDVKQGLDLITFGLSSIIGKKFNEIKLSFNAKDLFDLFDKVVDTFITRLGAELRKLFLGITQFFAITGILGSDQKRLVQVKKEITSTITEVKDLQRLLNIVKTNPIPLNLQLPPDVEKDIRDELDRLDKKQFDLLLNIQLSKDPTEIEGLRKQLDDVEKKAFNLRQRHSSDEQFNKILLERIELLRTLTTNEDTSRLVPIDQFQNLIDDIKKLESALIPTPTTLKLFNDRITETKVKLSSLQSEFKKISNKLPEDSILLDFMNEIDDAASEAILGIKLKGKILNQEELRAKREAEQLEVIIKSQKERIANLIAGTDATLVRKTFNEEFDQLKREAEKGFITISDFLQNAISRKKFSISVDVEQANRDIEQLQQAIAQLRTSEAKDKASLEQQVSFQDKLITALEKRGKLIAEEKEFTRELLSDENLRKLEIDNLNRHLKTTNDLLDFTKFQINEINDILIKARPIIGFPFSNAGEAIPVELLPQSRVDLLKKQLQEIDEVSQKSINRARSALDSASTPEEVKGIRDRLIDSLSQDTAAANKVIDSFLASDPGGRIGKSIQEGLQNGLGDVFEKVIVQAQNVGDAFKALASDILVTIAKLILNEEVKQFLNLLGGLLNPEAKGKDNAFGLAIGSLFSGLFRKGGIVSFDGGGIKNGRIPGTFKGFDDRLALVHSGEGFIPSDRLETPEELSVFEALRLGWGKLIARRLELPRLVPHRPRIAFSAGGISTQSSGINPNFVVQTIITDKDINKTITSPAGISALQAAFKKHGRLILGR